MEEVQHEPAFPSSTQKTFLLIKNNPLKTQRVCQRVKSTDKIIQVAHSYAQQQRTQHISSCSMHTEPQTEVFYNEYTRASQDFRPTYQSKWCTHPQKAEVTLTFSSFCYSKYNVHLDKIWKKKSQSFNTVRYIRLSFTWIKMYFFNTYLKEHCFQRILQQIWGEKRTKKSPKALI